MNKQTEKDRSVSVITPMYNAEKTIRDTIRSVQAQTWQDWEMIIVDDCSTDRSAVIVQEILQTDGRIRYFRNETNLGAAGSRNRALQEAKGRYAAFLDSDDLWRPEKLEKQIALLQQKKGVFAYTDCAVMDEAGNVVRERRNVPAEADYRKLLKGNAIPCLTVLLDLSVLGPVSMKRIPHEDYELWLRILQQGYTAYGLQESLAVYRETGRSLSGNKKQAAGWHWNILKMQPISFPRRICCFLSYMFNAVKKRM